MKRILILMVAVLTSVISMTSLVASSNVSEVTINPSDVVNQFIENIRAGRLTEAYLLTDQYFQSIIPQKIFIYFHEKQNFPTIWSYELGNTKIKDDIEAEVDVLFKESYSELDATQSSEAVIKLTKEADEWRICLDWEPYYPLKVDLLPPIAGTDHGDVAITLKYILLVPPLEKVTGYTNIRLDITNNSNRYVEWQLPMPGTAEGYLEDPDTGRIFYPSYAYGILSHKNQDYQFIPWKDNLGTMIIGPNAEVTLYIHIEEIIPDTTKELNLFLSGLSFCDNNEPWNIEINSIPCHFEILPVSR